MEIEFKHIAVEGVFHSGKTRLATLLAQRLGGKPVLDRAENPYLRDFYDEKDGAAFLTQLVFLVTRYHQQVGLIQRDLFEDRERRARELCLRVLGEQAAALGKLMRPLSGRRSIAEGDDSLERAAHDDVAAVHDDVAAERGIAAQPLVQIAPGEVPPRRRARL